MTRKLRPVKLPPEDYPQQISPWVRVRVWVKAGGNLPEGAIFQGAISVYQMRILVFSMKAVKVGCPQSGLCVKSHSVSALTDLN